MGVEVFAGQLFFAILVGALVGIEREHARVVHGSQIPFGLRTAIFFSVLGFLFSYFASITDNQLLLAVGAFTAVTISTAVYLANVWIKKHTGATTYVAMLIVFFTGVLIGFGGYTDLLLAAALSIVVTGFLVTKRMLVNWTHKLTFDEIFGAVKFGIIAFIILPLLPDSFIDPFNILNPFKIWYVIVAVSGVNFVSYVFLRHFASKGLAISAMFGGFISTSATVYNLALWIKKKKALLDTATGSMFLACITGFLSDFFILGFVLNAWDVVLFILPAFSAGAIVLLLFSYFYYEKKQHKEFKLDMKSPFAIMPAIKFAAFYVGLIAISSVFYKLFGGIGIYPVAFIASLVSSTTFITSIGSMLQLHQVTLADASYLVVFASIVSLLVKIFWIQEAKSRKLTKNVALGVVAAAAAMVMTIFVQSMLFV